MKRYFLFPNLIVFLIFWCLSLPFPSDAADMNPTINLGDDAAPHAKSSDNNDEQESDEEDYLTPHDYDGTKLVYEKLSQGSDLVYSVTYLEKGSFKVIFVIDDINWAEPDNTKNNAELFESRKSKLIGEVLAITFIDGEALEVVSYDEVSQSMISSENNMVKAEFGALAKLKEYGFRTIQLYNESPITFRCLENDKLDCLGYFAKYFDLYDGSWIEFKGLAKNKVNINVDYNTAYSLMELADYFATHQINDQTDNQNNDNDNDDDLKAPENDDELPTLREQLESILKWVDKVIDNKIYIADLQGFINRKTGALIISDPTGVSIMPNSDTIPSELADDRNMRIVSYEFKSTKMTITNALEFQSNLNLLKTDLRSRIESLKSAENMNQADENPAAKKKQKTKHNPPPAANENTESAPDSVNPSGKQENQD